MEAKQAEIMRVARKNAQDNACFLIGSISQETTEAVEFYREAARQAEESPDKFPCTALDYRRTAQTILDQNFHTNFALKGDKHERL